MIKSFLFSFICIISVVTNIVANEETRTMAVSTSTSSCPTQLRIATALDNRVGKTIEQEERCCAVLGRLFINAPMVILCSPLLVFDAMGSKADKAE